MKALKGIIILVAMVFGLGRVNAGAGDLPASFWDEVKAIVTYCEATKTFLSKTPNDEWFRNVLLATYKTCDDVSPGFTCDIWATNVDTFVEAFPPIPHHVLGKSISIAQLVGQAAIAHQTKLSAQKTLLLNPCAKAYETLANAGQK